MIRQKLLKCVGCLSAVFLLAACSGGGGSSSSSPTPTPATSNATKQGVAVDPFVVGAVFQEVAPDGVTILQRQSTPSDTSGAFSFPNDLTPGSTVEMKVSQKGVHAGAPFQGLLRRNIAVSDHSAVTVSPLTTMLANGIMPSDAILALNNAGFLGLTDNDLYVNPLTGVVNLTSGVTDQKLELLQAAMAVEAYMEITGNFRPTLSDVTNNFQAQILNSMGAALRSTLSAAEFTRITTALAGDPQMTGPLTLGDLIMAVVQQQQTLISLVKTDMAAHGGFNPTMVSQNVVSGMAQAMALAKAQFMTRVPPTTAADGAALYATNCARCHNALATSSKSGRTATQIQAAITGNYGGMGSLSNLTGVEIQAIATALAGSTPPPPPADGAALYAANCAGCHSALANTTKPGRTATQIQTAITSNTGNMGFLSTLTSVEIQAIAGALPAAPPPNPGTPPDGVALYNSECAGCHGALASTAKPGRTATQIQTAITNNTGNMGSLSTLTSAEIQAIAGALPAAPPPPVTPPSGATLYANNCAGCHGALASTTKAGRTAAQIQAAIANNAATGMGYLATLTSAEIQAIANALPAAPPGGPDYSNCTACHGQPPSGSSYPNVAGRHAVHTTLPSINNNCALCHAGAAHNGVVNLGVSTTFHAKSGATLVNSNMTCANISCHGGQTTPVWQTGSIAVDTQCTSCHASGSSQYNSYASGQHSRHISQGYACTVCHNPTKLATGHFTNLATSTFEQDPATTIGGGSTSVTTYTPSASLATSGSCSPKCHGSQTW